VFCVLTACSKAADDPTQADQTSIEAPTGTAFDGGPVYGLFEATDLNGETVTQSLSIDGTFTNMLDDEVVASGTYSADTDAVVCFKVDAAPDTPDNNAETDADLTAEDVEPACYYQSGLSEDGSWTATRDNNTDEVWKVRRLPE
jgi:hypothetical protein